MAAIDLPVFLEAIMKTVLNLWLVVVVCLALPYALGYGLERQRQYDIAESQRLCADGYQYACNELRRMK